MVLKARVRLNPLWDLRCGSPLPRSTQLHHANMEVPPLILWLSVSPESNPKIRIHHVQHYSMQGKEDGAL